MGRSGNTELGAVLDLAKWPEVKDIPSKGKVVSKNQRSRRQPGSAGWLVKGRRKGRREPLDSSSRPLEAPKSLSGETKG